ncbi:MAG: RsmE family RNA methyltransferase [Chitinophagales bacterium]
MSTPYFYLPGLDAGMNDFILDEDNSKHIVQVLRMSSGEQVSLTDGKGNLILSEITRADKKRCKLRKISSVHRPHAKRRICIGISLIKNNARFEWFLEKAAEIGVSEIVPLICERTERDHFRQDRMNAILVSAMLQSHQTWLSALSGPVKLKECIPQCRQQQKFIAYVSEKEEAHLSDLVNSNLNSQIILIGPEGDFSPEEIELAIRNNFLPASLGPTRLRTETAGIVAITLLNVD